MCCHFVAELDTWRFFFPSCSRRGFLAAARTPVARLNSRACSHIHAQNILTKETKGKNGEDDSVVTFPIFFSSTHKHRHQQSYRNGRKKHHSTFSPGQLAS